MCNLPRVCIFFCCMSIDEDLWLALHWDTQNAFDFLAAVNYVAISEALETSHSVLTAGLAADNVICAIYFATLFALASKIPAESSSPTPGKSEFLLNQWRLIYI